MKLPSISYTAITLAVLSCSIDPNGKRESNGHGPVARERLFARAHGKGKGRGTSSSGNHQADHRKTYRQIGRAHV